MDLDEDFDGETGVVTDLRRDPRWDALPLDSEARVFARVLDDDAALGLLSLLLRPPDFGGAFFFFLSFFDPDSFVGFMSIIAIVRERA